MNTNDGPKHCKHKCTTWDECEKWAFLDNRLRFFSNIQECWCDELAEHMCQLLAKEINYNKPTL